MSTVALARQMKGHLFGHGGEFCRQNASCPIQQDFTARTAQNPSKDQDVPEGIKGRELRQTVSEEDSERFIDASGSWIVGGHECLDMFQAFREFQPGVHFNAGSPKEPTDGLLTEVLGTNSNISRPLLQRGLCSVINGHEREFIQPGGDCALGSNETGRSACSHGQTQNCILFQGH